MGEEVGIKVVHGREMVDGVEIKCSVKEMRKVGRWWVEDVVGIGEGVGSVVVDGGL